MLGHRLSQGEGGTERRVHDVGPGDMETFVMTIIIGNFNRALLTSMVVSYGIGLNYFPSSITFQTSYLIFERVNLFIHSYDTTVYHNSISSFHEDTIPFINQCFHMIV